MQERVRIPSENKYTLLSALVRKVGMKLLNFFIGLLCLQKIQENVMGNSIRSLV